MFRQTLSILFFQPRPLMDFVGLRRQAVWALTATSALKGLFVIPYYDLHVLMQMLSGFNLHALLMLGALGCLLYWPGFLIFVRVLDAWLRRMNETADETASDAAADSRFNLLALAWAATDLPYLALQFQPNPSWLLAEPIWFVAVASAALAGVLPGLGFFRALGGVLVSLLLSATAVLGALWVLWALARLSVW